MEYERHSFEDRKRPTTRGAVEYIKAQRLSEKLMRNGKQYGKRGKATLDIVYCTSMIKALQQPQHVPAFYKRMGRKPWTIAPAAVGLGDFGVETGAVKFMPVLAVYQWSLTRIWTQP